MNNIMKFLIAFVIAIALSACGGGGDPVPPPPPGGEGADVVKPVITIRGNTIVTVEAGTVFTDPGADASDNKDGVITASIVTNCNVNTAVVGSYSCTYDVKDAAGNSADQKTRTVNVVDTTGPAITLQGPNPDSVLAGSPYVALVPGATAIDNIDGARPVVMTGSVNTAVVGTYTLTYSATDLSMHTSSVTRTVNVLPIPDTTPPVITPVGANPQIVYVGDIFVDPKATALDDVDGDITVNIVTNCNVNTVTAGFYSCTYNVSDSSGNPATQISRMVEVVAVPMATSGKLLFSGSRGAIGNWAGAIYLQDLSTGSVADLWGGRQCFGVGCGYVLPGVVAPSRVNGKAVLTGSNIHCLMITSLSLPAPVCAIPESSRVAVTGAFDPSQNADMVVLAQGFSSLTLPYRQHLMVFLTDGIGLYLQVTNSAADIDSAPVFASACDKNSTACDILFVRNGTDLLLQVINPSASLVVGAPTLFEANVVNVTTNATNGVRTHSVNADFTQVAYMKNVSGSTNICVKPKAGGVERCIAQGKDPFWTTDGSNLIMYTVGNTRMGIRPDGTGKVQFPTPPNLSFQGYTVDQFPGLVLGTMVMAP